MRFCPFCSAENATEATRCTTCARRLPPLPSRRRKPLRSVGVTPRPDAGLEAEAEAGETEAGEAEAGETEAGEAEAGEAEEKAVEEKAAEAATAEVKVAEAETAEARAVEAEAGEAQAAAAQAAAAQAAAVTTAAAKAADAKAALPAAAATPAAATPAAATPGGEARTLAPAMAPDASARPVPASRAASRDSGPLVAYRAPEVDPFPEVPDAGFLNAARYAIAVTRARWQRRDAIKALNDAISGDNAMLDEAFALLGEAARERGLTLPTLAEENRALDQAEERRRRAEDEHTSLGEHQSEEKARFARVEAERQARVSEAEAALSEAQQELGHVQAQERGLRDKRKTLERQQRGHLKAADERDDQAARAAMGDARAGLRHAAEELRRQAADLAPEIEEVERRIDALERPRSQAMAQVEAAQSQLDGARRNLDDAREEHRHRMAELDAEQSRKNRELSLAEAEIRRRRVVLGTLVNLHRVPDPDYTAHYERIDALREAIAGRTGEIDRLIAESDAFDRSSRTRGFVVLGAGVAAFFLVIAFIAALL